VGDPAVATEPVVIEPVAKGAVTPLMPTVEDAVPFAPAMPAVRVNELPDWATNRLTVGAGELAPDEVVLFVAVPAPLTAEEAVWLSMLFPFRTNVDVTETSNRLLTPETTLLSTKGRTVEPPTVPTPAEPLIAIEVPDAEKLGVPEVVVFEAVPGVNVAF